MADRIFLFTGGDPSTVALELALDTDNLQLLVPGSEIGTIETDDIWPYSGNTRWREWTRYKGKLMFPLKVTIEIHNEDPPAEWRSTALHELGHVLLCSVVHSPYVDHLMAAPSRVSKFADIEINVIKELYTRPVQTNILIFNNDSLFTKKIYEIATLQ